MTEVIRVLVAARDSNALGTAQEVANRQLVEGARLSA